jgi:hypothetical protein
LSIAHILTQEKIMAKNPFDIFRTEIEKTAHVEALDGDIKYRELTMGEADAFNKRLLKDYTGSGEPTIDMAEATRIGYEKIELCLIEPKMTVPQLQKLPASASKAINEIIRLIDGTTEEVVDEEGNSSD